MAERPFFGFEFKTVNQEAFPNLRSTSRPLPPIELNTVPHGVDPDIIQVEVQFNDFTINPFIAIDTRPFKENKTIRKLRREFSKGLRGLGSAIGYPRLTMEGRSIFFVDKNVLNPQSEIEKELQREYYGNVVSDVAGDTTRVADGSFILRIRRPEDNSEETIDTIVATMAHEYGHTLGRVNGAVDDELLAYTFEDLFMRRKYERQEDYEVMTGELDEAHDIAIIMLDEMLKKRIPHGAIIAYLTGKKFGTYLPEDLKHFV